MEENICIPLGSIMLFLLKNRYLLTLWYCELSVTEFVFVFVFCSTLCWILDVRTFTFSLHHLFFNYYYFIHCLYFLLLAGLNLFMWDVSFEHGCHILNTEDLFRICLYESVICFIYVGETSYHAFFIFLFTIISHRGSEAIHFLCLCYQFVFHWITFWKNWDVMGWHDISQRRVSYQNFSSGRSCLDLYWDQWVSCVTFQLRTLWTTANTVSDIF